VITRRVLKDIRIALDFLGATPGAGHVREDLRDRPLKFLPIYSYQIVCDPETKPVQAVRVLHGMRDIEGILN
jgi:plasmid stabilization system protein ParE